MSNNSFNAALSAQLGALDEVAPPRQGGRFAPRMKHPFNPGPKVQYVKKGGSFEWKVTNAKGNQVPMTTPKMRGVILDFGFQFRVFRQQEDGSYKTTCASTSHVEMGSDGQLAQGNGWWKVPAYEHNTIFQAYNPVGMKWDPELKDESGNPLPLTCERCHALGLNLENPGEPFDKDKNKVACKDNGYVVVGVFSRQDPITEEWKSLETPELMTFTWGRLGNDSFARYLRELSKLAMEYQVSAEDFITEFSVGAPDRNSNHKAVLTAEYPEDPALIARIKAQYAEEKDQWQAERDAWVEAQRAKESEASGDKGKAQSKSTVTPIAEKRQAKAVGGVKKAVAASADDTEELPF